MNPVGTFHCLGQGVRFKAGYGRLAKFTGLSNHSFQVSQRQNPWSKEWEGAGCVCMVFRMAGHRCGPCPDLDSCHSAVLIKHPAEAHIYIHLAYRRGSRTSMNGGGGRPLSLWSVLLNTGEAYSHLEGLKVPGHLTLRSPATLQQTLPFRVHPFCRQAHTMLPPP